MTPRTLARLLAVAPLGVGLLGVAIGYAWPPYGRLANAAASGVLLAWALVCLRQARRLVVEALRLRVEADRLYALGQRIARAHVPDVRTH